MYQLFHSRTASPDVRKFKPEDDDGWGAAGRDRAYVSQLAKALGEMTPTDRNLLAAVARKVSKRK